MGVIDDSSTNNTNGPIFCITYLLELYQNVTNKLTWKVHIFDTLDIQPPAVHVSNS